MKPILSLIIVCLFSCTEKTDTIEGSWSLTRGYTGGDASNSSGYLWENLIFQNDSVFIAESQFFKGPHVPYKIDNDSIEFEMAGSPKFRFTLEDGSLYLSGEHERKGCKFTESKTYQRFDYELPVGKIMRQDSINQYQLSYSSWCKDGVIKIEKHISNEKSVCTMNINDSTGMDYFPPDIDFNSSNIIQTAQLTFNISSNRYGIEHYDGHKLLIRYQSNDTTFYMPYRLCEDRVVKLR